MEVPRHWRLKQQRYGLVGSKCPDGHVSFPPRDVCPDCVRLRDSVPEAVQVLENNPQATLKVVAQIEE